MVGLAVVLRELFGPIAHVLDGDDFAGRNLDGLIDNAKTPAYNKVNCLFSQQEI